MIQLPHWHKGMALPPLIPYNRVMNEIQSRCIALADALANEINGNLCYVPDEEIESCLAGLTESNLNETAEELAQLAAWFN